MTLKYQRRTRQAGWRPIHSGASTIPRIMDALSGTGDNTVFPEPGRVHGICRFYIPLLQPAKRGLCEAERSITM